MSDVPMTRSEEALAQHSTRYFHDSSFVLLADGALLHAAGGVFTRSTDGGLTWSKEFRCTDTAGAPVGSHGTSLVRLDGMGIGLAGMRREAAADAGKEPSWSSHLVFWRSPDSGRTWEPPVRITPPNVPTFAYQDVLLRTAAGRLVLPVYTMLGQSSGPDDRVPPACGKLVNNQWVSTAAHFFDPRFSAVYVCYSDDGGHTWQRNRDGELLILLDWNSMFSFVNEPSVTEVQPDRLLMVMRTGLGRLFQAWSDDGGSTWTRPQPTSLAASPAPAQIRTLPAGHLLCVWNQESAEEIQQGFNRTRLSAAVSRNGGSVWEFFQNVESLLEGTRVEPGLIEPVRPAEIHFPPGQPGPVRAAAHVRGASAHGRWSYPSVCVLPDRVLIAHTYSLYQEHPDRAELLLTSKLEGGMNQRLKVLPLKWFYGGKEPADNPFLRQAYAPAKP